MIPSSPHHHHASADGGGRPASALALISLSHGVNHAQGALKPLIYPLILREFGVGYGELGIMLGVASALGGLLQLAAGALGTIVRRHLLLGFGNALGGASVLLTAFAPSFPQFFLWNVVERVGSAAQHPVGSSLIAHHFQEHRLGLALATHFSAGNLGTAFVPFVAALLIGLWGWRVTTVLFAIPAILMGVALVLWMSDPRTHAARAADAPAGSLWRSTQRALANRRLRWILLAMLVAAGGSGHGSLSVYLPLYLTHDIGLEGAAMGFVFSLFMVGSIVGPLLGGRLVDRFDRQRVVLGASGVAALVTLVFPQAATHPLLLPLGALVLGSAAFGVHPILQTVVAQVTEGEVRDIAFALFYSASFLAGALWAPAIGYIAQGFGLQVAFAAMAGSFVLAGLCLVPSRLNEATPALPTGATRRAAP